MTLYATERVEDAASLTRSLLFPFDLGLWARLAVVVAFLGVGSGGGSITSQAANVPSTGASVTGISGTTPSASIPSDVFGTDLLVVAAAVVATIAVLWLVFGFVGATLEFVFVDALAEQSLAIRQGFREHVGRGVRLFAFRVVLFGLTAVILGGLALALFWGPITTLLSGGSPAIGGTRIVVSVGLFVLVGVVVGTLAALVHGLTTEFVVPVMLETGCGVLDGWRKLWPTVRAQWKQYLVYVLVALGLRIATTAAAGIVLGIVTIVLAIPFAVVAFLVGLGAVTSGTVSTATAIGLAVVGIAFLVVVVLASAAVYVPVTAFHRYFALLFVGDVDRRFDVLGERRPPIDDGFSLF